MFQIDDAKLLDLVAKSDDPFTLPVHLLLRVWPEGGTLRFAFLETDWLKDQAKQQLPTHAVGDRTVIAAPVAAVQAFVAKYGADDKAHQEPEILYRVQ